MTLLHPSARYSLLVRQRIRVALGAAAALAAISLSPGSAQAYVVTVNGVQYDVTTFTGSYDANTSKFALPPAPGVMPWWANQSLASQFAVAVAGGLGFPNDASVTGPIFGYEYGPYDEFYLVSGRAFSPALGDESGSALIFSASVSTRTWAQATLYTVPTPVPAPLPLLGSAAALSFCRRLSSRSKRLRHGASRLA